MKISGLFYYLMVFRSVLLIILFVDTIKGSPLDVIYNMQERSNHENKIDNHITTHMHRMNRHSREFRRLQNQIDKLSLKQEIDKIHIENLQKTVKNVNKNVNNIYRSNELEKNEETRRHDKKGIAQTYEDKRSKPLTQDTSALENQIMAKIEIQIRRAVEEEVQAIREEISELKKCCDTCKKATSSSSSVPTSNELRDHTAVQWAVQILPTLQRNVKDLQDSTSVIKSLHEKQDWDSKFLSVTEDVRNLQKSLSSLKSEVVTSRATSDSMLGEMKENSQRVHQSENKIVQLEEKLDEERHSLNDLLEALPDGILSSDRRSNHQDFGSAATATESDIPSSNHLAIQHQSSHINSHNQQKINLKKRSDELYTKSSSLDFTLMELNNKVLSKEPSDEFQDLSKSENNIGDFTDKKIEEIEFELSKFKDSSKTILNTISIFDKRNDKKIDNLNLKLSMLDSQIQKEKEERKSINIDTKSDFIETRNEIRNDYIKLKKDIIILRNEIKRIENLVSNIDDSKAVDISNSESSVIKNVNCSNEVVRPSIIDPETKLRLDKFQEQILILESKVKTQNILLKNFSKMLKKRRHKHGWKTT